jgi:hypothetical protein
MKEGERRARADVHRRRRQRPPVLDERGGDRLRLEERAPVERPRRLRDRGVARVQEQEPFLGEQLGEHAGEGIDPGRARAVVPREPGQMRGRVRRRAERRRQLGEGAVDLGGERQLGDRDPIFGARRQANGHRSVGSAAAALGDLGEIVVLGLEPEHRHHRRARELGEGARDADRRRRLVDGVERAQEQPHLLPGHDRGRAPPQRRQVGVARRARGQARAQPLEGGAHLGSKGPRRALDRAPARVGDRIGHDAWITSSTPGPPWRPRP